MAILNLGGVSWGQVVPEKWNLSDYDLDHLVVTVDGREDQRLTYQGTLTQWDASAIDGNMYLANWASTDERHYPKIDLHYIGRKDGVLPVVRSSNGFSLQTTTTKVTSGGVDYTAEFQFYAITTKYDWIANSLPGDTPTYSGVLSGLNPQGHLVSYRVTASDGSTSLPYSVFIDLFNALSVSEVISDYHFEVLVPAKYWRVTATSMRTLLGN